MENDEYEFQRLKFGWLPGDVEIAPTEPDSVDAPETDQPTADFGDEA